MTGVLRQCKKGTHFCVLMLQGGITNMCMDWKNYKF